MDLHTEDTIDEGANLLPVFVEAFNENMTFGRKIMIMRTGYVGLAHFLSQVGDAISLLAECTMPMVLRKCEHGYRFTGEAYVHGVMNGQAWNMRKGDVMEEFHIFSSFLYPDTDLGI